MGLSSCGTMGKQGSSSPGLMQNAWGGEYGGEKNQTNLNRTWDVPLQKVLLKHIRLLWFSEHQYVCSWLKSHKIWTKCFPYVLHYRSSLVAIFSLFCERNFNMGQDYGSDGTATVKEKNKTNKHSFIPVRSSTLEVWEWHQKNQTRTGELFPPVLRWSDMYAAKGQASSFCLAKLSFCLHIPLTSLAFSFFPSLISRTHRASFQQELTSRSGKSKGAE